MTYSLLTFVDDRPRYNPSSLGWNIGRPLFFRFLKACHRVAQTLTSHIGFFFTVLGFFGCFCGRVIRLQDTRLFQPSIRMASSFFSGKTKKPSTAGLNLFKNNSRVLLLGAAYFHYFF